MSDSYPSHNREAAAMRFIPLSLLRLWCRRQNSWLSFNTAACDRYLIGTRGYFIELPDGCLEAIVPHVAFPVLERFASVNIDKLQVQTQFVYGFSFISVPETGPRAGKPRGVALEDLVLDLEDSVPSIGNLSTE